MTIRFPQTNDEMEFPPTLEGGVLVDLLELVLVDPEAPVEFHCTGAQAAKLLRLL